MNEAFEGMLEVQTINRGMKKGKELSYFNLIDVGVITSVTGDKCSVQSYRMLNNRNVIYNNLELVYPGGTGSVSPEGMTCIVVFPAETTNLDEKTISTLKPFFSMFGGKVIPVTTQSDCDVKVGPSYDRGYYLNSDNVTLRMDKTTLSLSVTGTFTMRGDLDTLSITLLNGNVILYIDNATNTIIKTQLNNETPFVHEVDTPTERWVGYAGYKAMSHNDIKYDVTKYVKTDFNFVEDYLATERWIYIYKNDGSVLASLCIDNTGEIYVGTEEKITVEAKKDVTVDRDGTKLEVKNGKVVVTGDLEVSGKTTITGMKTDVQNFFDGLTSALNSMFTLGSPATHNTDGGFKANIATLRSKL